MNPEKELNETRRNPSDGGSSKWEQEAAELRETSKKANESVLATNKSIKLFHDAQLEQIERNESREQRYETRAVDADNRDNDREERDIARTKAWLEELEHVQTWREREVIALENIAIVLKKANE